VTEINNKTQIIAYYWYPTSKVVPPPQHNILQEVQ
jgi:hypothetical protein